MATVESDDEPTGKSTKSSSGQAGSSKTAATKKASAKKTTSKPSGTATKKKSTNPAAHKSAPKKSAAKKAGKKPVQEKLSAAQFKPSGTFMPADEDPLDTPAPAIARAAAQLSSSEHDVEPLTRGVTDPNPQPVEKHKISSVEDLDRRSKIRAALQLDTDEANDYGRAALVVAGTTVLAVIVLLGANLPAAIYAGVVAYALVGGLAAVYLGVRGYRSAVRGVATNPRVAQLGILTGGGAVIATLVILVMRAFAT